MLNHWRGYLHKSEVFTVGRALNVPESILRAAPTADLWDGQEDEDELGFPYDFVEFYTQYLALEESERARVRASLDNAGRRYLEETGRITGRPEKLAVDSGMLELTLPGGTGDLLRFGAASFPGLDK